MVRYLRVARARPTGNEDRAGPAPRRGIRMIGSDMIGDSHVDKLRAPCQWRDSLLPHGSRLCQDNHCEVHCNLGYGSRREAEDIVGGGPSWTEVK